MLLATGDQQYCRENSYNTTCMPNVCQRERYRGNMQMITAIILSFLGSSCLASIIVFAACVASSRADRIQQGAFHQTFTNGEYVAADGQSSVANSQLALASPSL